MAIDTNTQQRLYHETDLRFWANVGYQPGQKLDPHDAHDALMIPIWQKVYANVLAEYNAGRIHWTQDQGVVPALVAGAANATAQVAQSVASAASAADQAAQAAHLQDAGAQHQLAQDATKTAGMVASSSGAVVHPDDVRAVAAQAAANPPPAKTPQDVAKAMQIASAPKHAGDVMTFQMQGGKGVYTGTGTAPAGSYGGAGIAPPIENPHVTKWTPLVVLGSVGAAIGLGSLILHAAGPSTRRRPRRSGRSALLVTGVR